MGYHSFSLDPRTVLGVGPSAGLDEIHEAFRSKSKKHHPDLGGDEWAFRMVTRAYEVLKATATSGGESTPRQANGWTSEVTENGANEKSRTALDEFQSVEVDLIWMRFETDGPVEVLSVSGESEGTLSVCLVVSWPATNLVSRAVEYDCVVKSFELSSIFSSVYEVRVRCSQGDPELRMAGSSAG